MLVCSPRRSVPVELHQARARACETLPLAATKLSRSLPTPQAPAPMAFPVTTPQVPVYGMVSWSSEPPLRLRWCANPE